MKELETLFGGILGLIAAGGMGLGFTHLLGPIPPRWRLATSLVVGVALIDWVVMLTLFLGGGGGAVKLVGIASIAISLCFLVSFRKIPSVAPGLNATRRADGWFMAVILAAVAINLLIAAAPSTKIDELHYHMLIPKRIMEDGGLHLYRRPFEAAIFPQTGFQLGLAAAHAVGFPEAGNVLSWGLGVALVLLIAGITADLTGSISAGWMSGGISAVGLYPAVWHVASGPHALGDLATVTALLLALLPDDLTGELKASTRLFLICLCAYAAASTKISLLPLAAVLTAVGAQRAAASMGWKKAVGIAAGVWIVLYGPIILWTTLQCGSPFGLATAGLFRSHYFGPEVIAELRDSARENQRGWGPLLLWLAPSVSIGVVAAFGIVAFAAFRGRRIYKTLGALVLGQAILIAWLLPHEFRFLGGLQYAVLIFGLWEVWPSRLGGRLIAHGWAVLVACCLPWLAIQAYYARPFIKVGLGMTSRDNFLREYVAFADDFRSLDRILPVEAVIYAPGLRSPSYYFPRPVIYTLDDLRGRGPVYRFAVGSGAPPAKNSLSCSEVVYKNPSAISVVFRTPGRPPAHEPLTVARCGKTGTGTIFPIYSQPNRPFRRDFAGASTLPGVLLPDRDTR